MKDALGITLTDTTGLLESPPSCVLYAPAGFGKSTEAAKAFNSGLFLVHDPDVLRPFAHWLATNPKEAAKRELKMPATKVLPAFEPGGPATSENRVGTKDLLEQILGLFVEARMRGDCPYTTIVIDEASELLKRVNEDIRIAAGRDPFAALRQMNEFVAWLGKLPEHMGVPIVLICHDRPPKWHDDDSPDAGKIQYKGGPELPTGPLRKEVCSMVSVVLRGEVKREGFGNTAPKRFWCTQIDPLWESKIRAFDVEPEADIDLYKLLTAAGYRL
jgi:hypothetical protein